MPSKDLIILDKLIGYSEDICDYVLDMDKEKFVADSKTMAACAFCQLCSSSAGMACSENMSEPIMSR